MGEEEREMGQSGAILGQIGSQPALLARLLGRTAELEQMATAVAAADVDQLVLTGCGDMAIASRWVAQLFEGWGWRSVVGLRAMDWRWHRSSHEWGGLATSDRATQAHVSTPEAQPPEAAEAAEAQEATQRSFGEGRSLWVACSVSGRTPRTIEALRGARQLGDEGWALTDDPTSALASNADRCVILGSADLETLHNSDYPGYAVQVGQTSTFTATLLLQLVIAAHFCRNSSRVAERNRADALLQAIARLPECVREAVSATNALASATSDTSFGETILPNAQSASEGTSSTLAPQVRVLGSGPWSEIAAYGAAKLVEFAVPAASQCVEEFHHLDVYLLPPGSWIIALAPDAASRQRLAEVVPVWEELQCNVVLCGSELEEFGTRSGLFSWELPSQPTSVETGFALIVALQRLGLDVAKVWGRDVERWLGGVRPDFHNGISSRTVRGSRIETGPF